MAQTTSRGRGPCWGTRARGYRGMASRAAPACDVPFFALFIFPPYIFRVPYLGMDTTPTKVARPPPSTGHPLFQMAMGFAKQAVALDRDKNYGAAVPNYTRAAEALVDFMGITRNPKLLQLCAEKVQEYTSRAKFLWNGLQPRVARVTPVHEPPRSCAGCRFYDRYRDNCRSVAWHLMRERRNEDLHCPSKETGSGLYCPGGKCYGCTPGAGCDD